MFTMLFSLIAQAQSVEAIKQVTDAMMDKDLKWWLIGGLVTGGSFFALVIKWLFASHQRSYAGLEAQLSEQRAANSEKDKMLLTYLKEDHVKSLETQREITAALEKMVGAINRIVPGTGQPPSH